MGLISKALHIAKREGYTSLARKVALYFLKKVMETNVIGRARVAIASRKLREYIKGLGGIDEVINFAYSFGSLGINVKPNQVKEEISELLRVLKDLNPEALLEIGTANGGTLFLLTQVAGPDAAVISVDLPGGRFGGGYPVWKIPLYKSFTKYGSQKIYLLRADSHDPKTLKAIEEILGGEELDFLFIDGDHTYEGVKKDFETYGKLVRIGGIIAFHDIVPSPEEFVGGVPKFWHEIRNRFRHLEIVKDWNQRGYGIGLLFKQLR